MKPHLVIFARAPRRGTVKRRLAADIGTGPALAFYRRTLHDIVRRLGNDPRWRTWLAVTPDCEAARRGLWPSAPGVCVIGQGGGDLGDRMARSLRTLPPGPAMVVGSDIPDITSMHIADGFAALGTHDLVFGPAADGGFWLVGARRRRAVPVRLFRDVRWSTAHALADTLAGLPGHLHVKLLDELYDVDDGPAWYAWRSRLDVCEKTVT